VLVVFILSFLTLNAALVTAANERVTGWLDNAEHRLPNIRLLPPQCRAVVVRKFIQLQDWTVPTLLVFGDSQPFSEGLPLDKTWPYLAAQKANLKLRVVNLAVIDGRPEDTKYVAEQVPPHTADIAIVNINQRHFSAEPLRHIEERQPQRFEWEKCIISMRRTLALESLPLPDARKARENYTRLPLTPDHYSGDPTADTIVHMVDAVSVSARRAIAFVTPNNTDAFIDYGYNVEEFRRMSNLIEAACQRSGLATCFDASTSMRMGSYRDIVHLNSNGNALFADMVAPYLLRHD
jgi:hypothetical protein